MPNCPCGLNKTLEKCCGRYLSGKELAPTPEALMRSRYTAYTLSDMNYIASTMKEPASNNFDFDESIDWCQHTTWRGLDVRHAAQSNNTGTVEFIAHFTYNRHEDSLHEISEFRLDDGKWYYIDGKQF